MVALADAVQNEDPTLNPTASVDGISRRPRSLHETLGLLQNAINSISIMLGRGTFCDNRFRLLPTDWGGDEERGGNNWLDSGANADLSLIGIHHARIMDYGHQGFHQFPHIHPGPYRHPEHHGWHLGKAGYGVNHEVGRQASW